MSRTLYAFQLKRNAAYAIWLGVLMALLSLGSMVTFNERTEALLIEARPQAKALFEAFRVGGSLTLLDHIVSLAYGFLLPVLGSLWSVHLSARLFPGLIETKEMSFYLSLPLRRSRFALIQGAVLLSCLVIAVLTGTLFSAAAAAVMIPNELNLSGFAVLNGGLLCLWMLSGGIALMVACAGDQRRSVRRRSYVLIGVFFLIAMLGGIRDWPRLLAWLSPYSLYDAQNLARGRFLPEILIMPMAGMFCFLIGIRQFSRRDLPL